MEERLVDRHARVVEGERLKTIRHQRDISHLTLEGFDLKALRRILISQEVCRVGVLAALWPKHPAPPIPTIIDYDHTIANLERGPAAWPHHRDEEGRRKITGLCAMLLSFGEHCLAGASCGVP